MFIFSRNHQTVKITAANPNATIYHNDDSVGVGSATIRLDKRFLFECVKLKADGYLTKNYTFGTTKYSPAIAVAALDMAGALLSLQKVIARLRRFDNEIKVPPLTPKISRQPNEKYILVNKFSIDTKEEDIVIVEHKSYIKYIDYLKNSDEPTLKKSNRFPSDSINIYRLEYSKHVEGLTYLLKQMSFNDTVAKLFQNDLNILYINASIHKIKMHVVNFINPHANSTGQWNYSNMLVLEMDIKWDIVNKYGQPIYNTKTSLYSDGFQFEAILNSGRNVQFNRKLKDTVYVEEALNKAFNNNINYAFLQVKDELTKNTLLKTTVDKDTMENITIHKGITIVSDKIGDYLDASVSVKVDDGHGSGFCISRDGYILTNYHVVANTKNIEVILNDGSTETANLIRYSKTGDLALLKINRENLQIFNLTNMELPILGTEVWAIGTPKSIELGQSVSKGIVSTFQKGAEVLYLQTDVKISPGNSGGPLFAKGGILLGMITMKVVDNQTEGIGFAIFAPEILRLLKIDLKD